MTCFSPGVTLCTEPYKPRGVCSNDGKNGADLEDVCPLVLSYIGFTGHPLFGAFWSVRRQYIYIGTPLLCLKKMPGTLDVLFCD